MQPVSAHPIISVVVVLIVIAAIVSVWPQSTPTGGANKGEPSALQGVLIAIDHRLEQFCSAPSAAQQSAARADVKHLIAIYHADPRAVVPTGGLFGGLSIRQVLARFGGLLNRCTPTLATEIGKALAGRLSGVPRTVGGSSATEAELISIDHDLEAFCKTPTSTISSAVTADVDRLIALYRKDPSAVQTGTLFTNLTMTQIMGRFGGLLNKGGCAPPLAAKIGEALR